MKDLMAFPDHISNPCPLWWKTGPLTTVPPGKFLYIFIYNGKCRCSTQVVSVERQEKKAEVWALGNPMFGDGEIEKESSSQISPQFKYLYLLYLAL